jgi:hypothetical protein
MSTITVPGDIFGLLRRGSPVVFYPEDVRGITIGLVSRSGTSRAEVAYLNRGNPAGAPLPLAEVALDLTDATGRAHAAWWLASKMPTGQRPHHSPLETTSWVSGSFGWLLTNMREGHRGWRGSAGGLSVGTMPQVLPALADLDPNDVRLLPDGSRWVDAEALRRVVLHVAGVTP